MERESVFDEIRRQDTESGVTPPQQQPEKARPEISPETSRLPEFFVVSAMLVALSGPVTASV